MKKLLIVCDGMDDSPLECLGGMTPGQYARTPNMDLLESMGSVRMIQTTPCGMNPGSEVAITTLLGYDARVVAQSRAPFEAAGVGYMAADDELLLRCNIIGVSADGVVTSHDGGGFTDSEGRIFVDRMAAGMKDERVRIIAGQDYRHILAVRGGSREIVCTPAHEMTGQRIADHLVRAAADTPSLIGGMTPAETATLLNGLIKEYGIWPWSPGFRPLMEPLGVKGAAVTAVNLVRGIAQYSGLRLIEVAGATGKPATNYEGKVEAALEALRTDDFVMLHLEGPDEASHARNLDGKIRAIEMIDSRVVGPVIGRLREYETPVGLTVTPDHGTSVTTGSHLPFPVRAINAVFQHELKGIKGTERDTGDL
ncbi:MAG: phosphoglycerate mutase [Muribaculaceae bacterium]|nr:phosphoglycerate mutase [Muribaculaceae bacterium]